MKYTFLTLVLLALSFTSLNAETPAKREFRGTWIHTVGQSKYATMTQDQMKSYFITLLDKLEACHINTVLFQVRPEADAWYASKLEPWSRYITGIQGKDPGWDPLAFLIEEYHKRNIDLHAWLNPYRARASRRNVLAPGHVYRKHPEWFVDFGDLLWFDPGNPSCRSWIRKVVCDIVERYDVDGIHMDDYFYPYPVAGQNFDDSRSFNKYAASMGFGPQDKADWRRQNVNLLVRELHESIVELKPWVQFGISPFGIWRNQKTDPTGSKTNGLSNYDDLYADVLTWTRNGWIDYNIPQLYWEIGHRAADYTTLLEWWAANRNGVALYIGQDVLRSVKPDSSKRKQLAAKLQQAAGKDDIGGNCFWPGYEIENNAGNIANELQKQYYRYPAIQPADNPRDQTPPAEIRDLACKKTSGGANRQLVWNAPEFDGEMDRAVRYVVYRFGTAGSFSLDRAENIVAITREIHWNLPSGAEGAGTFVVTALDRCHNESKGKSISVK